MAACFCAAITCAQCVILCRSVARLSGLAMKSAWPAAREASRSLSIHDAVSAMITGGMTTGEGAEDGTETEVEAEAAEAEGRS